MKSVRPMSKQPTRYRFKAADPSGTVQTGVVAAESQREAESELQRRGLFSLSVAVTDGPSTSRRRASQTDQAAGLRSLATLLEAGIPVRRIPATLAPLVPASWAGAVDEISAHLREGRAFAAALDSSSLGLPRDVVEIVRAGESAGQLASSVRVAANEMEARVAARAALLGALAYPCILALTAVVAVALLVGIVLPRFAKILAEAGGVLPPSTLALLEAAHVARAGFLPTIIIVAAVAVLARQWVRHDAGRQAWHRMLLGVPAIGVIRRALASSRFCGALAALLKSGTPLAVALRHAAPASGDAHVTFQVERARSAVIGGASLSYALRQHPALADSTVRLIQVGETSGELTRMLSHCTHIEHERAQERMKSLMRLVEPTLILFFGGIVAVIAAAMLQALYSLTPGA